MRAATRPFGLPVVFGVLLLSLVLVGGHGITVISPLVSGQGYVLFGISVALVISAAGLLRGAAVGGFLLGTYTVGYHVTGWTLPGSAILLYLWSAVLAAYLGLFALTVRRPLSLRMLREPAFLIGVLPWLPGTIGAVVVGSWQVAAQRLLFGMVALGAYIFIWAREQSLIGVIRGMLLGQTIVLGLITSCALLEPLTLIRQSVLFQASRSDALAGGECALVHPNLLASFALPLAVSYLVLRIPGWSRILGLAAACAIMFLADSRGALGAFLIAVAVVASGKIRSHLAPIQERTNLRPRAFASVAIALLLISGLGLVGQDFFARERFTGGGILTGRQFIWSQAFEQIRSGSLLEILLGNTSTAVFEVQLQGVPFDVGGHNAGIDIWGRAGFIGLLLATVGLIMLLRRALQSFADPAARFGGAMLLALISTVPITGLITGSLFFWLLAATASASHEPSPLKDRSPTDRSPHVLPVKSPVRSIHLKQ